MRAPPPMTTRARLIVGLIVTTALFGVAWFFHQFDTVIAQVISIVFGVIGTGSLYTMLVGGRAAEESAVVRAFKGACMRGDGETWRATNEKTVVETYDATYLLVKKFGLDSTIEAMAAADADLFLLWQPIGEKQGLDARSSGICAAENWLGTLSYGRAPALANASGGSEVKLCGAYFEVFFNKLADTFMNDESIVVSAEFFEGSFDVFDAFLKPLGLRTTSEIR